ncbi:YifB family Mg chelatase-like AAA ATPase [Klugiella xanthotipulae]|uniref:Magnesium chelatase family protein n=1 Tax=Klugiella xanthotipulae TaxID=244735 RepID=A0A543HRX1_9MICO|nr:YifB family Mg chelatase-like AAA ATPase [Klugiella xanthotipulae]TQM61080.1 magnesium chelatase family protein [Klugiella xanthotipulae]
MVVARTRGIALSGLDGHPVEVEADVSHNLPGFVIIGLPDAALGEAKERVRLAASNSGCPLTDRKLTVNLSPASLPKHGAGFDLAIAMASLASAGSISAASIRDVVHVGELRLDGRLRGSVGILPAVVAARRAGISTVMVPAPNAREASLVPDMTVLAVSTLREAARWHGGDYPESNEAVEETWDPDPVGHRGQTTDPCPGDLKDIIGNDEAVSALIVAAAGGHNMSLLGPPGAGKTMLASRLVGLLPDLDDEASLEASCVRSLAGFSLVEGLVTRPPFESPHHTASAAALIGGGSSIIRPGAAARAAHGVLFIDEAPEFPAAVLDSLRQPLESGRIVIHRARSTAYFPGRFQLVLAANPCPCGNYGVRDAECTCPPNTRKRYLGRVSGPLKDRIDIHLNVNRITAAQLRVAEEDGKRTSTAEARARVLAARSRAACRLSGSPWKTNGEVSGAWLRSQPQRLSPATTVSLDRALETGFITMRGYDRVLRLAWTLADLSGELFPHRQHVGEALLLRSGVSL